MNPHKTLNIKNKFALVVTLFCITPMAFADGAYVKLEVGRAYANSAGFVDRNGANSADCSICNSGSTQIDHLDNSPFAAIGIGYRWNENIRFDVMLSRRGNNLNHFDPKNGVNNKYHSSIESNSLMLSGYYDFRSQANAFRPYLGAGGGVTNNKMSNVTQNILGYGPNAFEVDPGGQTMNFSWQIMLGTEYQFNNNWSADFGYRYFDGGKLRTDSGQTVTNFAGNSISGGIVGHLRTNELVLSLRRSF